MDKCYQNKPRYPLDGDLSGGQRYPAFEQLGPDNLSLSPEKVLETVFSGKGTNPVIGYSIS